MRAEILAVGSELLQPSRIERNSLYLTEKLAAVGIPVVFRGITGDDEQGIADCITHALARADLVFVSGGLGPTADDLTRGAACRSLGLSMHLDRSLLEELEARFARRGIEMPPVNRQQAMVLEGATVLPNRVGTAPGLLIPAGRGKRLVLLPGPPAELQSVFENELMAHLASEPSSLFYRVLKLWIAGLPESVVEQRVQAIYTTVANPSTTVLASAGQVELRLTAKGASPEEADAANERLARELRERLGDAIFTEAEEPLEEVVGRLLETRGMRITVAESITGGLIAHRITQVSGSSRYFDQGFVTYSNESKTELLGVPAELLDRVGAVSEGVAKAMARGARERAGADVAVAVTGIAGPTGGTPTKPVGLVYIGLALEGTDRVERHQFPGTRHAIKQWASQVALNMVRLELLVRGHS